MKEAINIDSSIKENINENNPAKGVKEFLDVLDLKLNEASVFLDKLSDNDLNEEERSEKVDQFIDHSEQVVDFSLQFMNEKRKLLDEQYSYQCFFIIKKIHDLKAQIAPMVGYAYDFLKEENISQEEFSDYLGIIKFGLQEAKEMSKNFRNANLENPEINLSYINVSNLLENLSDRFSKIAKIKNINIDTKIEPHILFNTCSGVLESAIRNLLNNAIKFTNDGGRILVSLEKSDNNIVVRVKDNGVGISKEKQSGLFKKMGQTSKGTRGEMGTGVGLYVNFDEIKQLNGTLDVESEGEGRGTTFIITLPEGKE